MILAVLQQKICVFVVFNKSHDLPPCLSRAELEAEKAARLEAETQAAQLIRQQEKETQRMNELEDIRWVFRGMVHVPTKKKDTAK